METETLTIRFDGQSHQVDVQTFVYSVLNFATVVKETNRKNGRQSNTADVKTQDCTTTITLDNNSTLSVAENVYNIYVTTQTIPDAISKNFSALNEDPAVTHF